MNIDRKKTDTEQIRIDNRREIIETLRVYGPMARVMLGRQTGLSPATVTAITSDLMAEGLLKEVKSEPPASPASRGRPRVLIDLNEESSFVLGIKLSMNELRYMLGDMKGQIVAEKAVELDTLALNSDSLMQTILDGIDEFMDSYTREKERLCGCGVAIQGFVNANEGEIVWSPALSFRHCPVTLPLSDALDIPVVVANDANCIAIAIRNQPEYQSMENFAVIMLGYGVGMGVIIDGALYSGFHGAAAEFGHTKYTADGPQCNCGKKGCIEAYVSDYAIYRKAKTLVELPETNELHPSDLEMSQLLAKAESGDPNVLEIYKEAGEVLGYGIANLMALFSPEKIVISGQGVRAYKFLEAGINAGVESALVKELISETTIEPYSWQKDITGIGILALALKAIY